MSVSFRLVYIILRSMTKEGIRNEIFNTSMYYILSPYLKYHDQDFELTKSTKLPFLWNTLRFVLNSIP